MNKTIREACTRLQALLPAHSDYYSLPVLRAAGFPESVVLRIHADLADALAASVQLPATEWAQTDSPKVREAWVAFLQTIHDEVVLPRARAAEMVDNAVIEVVEMAVSPRQRIPELLFGVSQAADFETLAWNSRYVTVHRYLADALLRYMERKNLNEIDRAQAEAIIARVDERYVANFTPLNWAQLLDPLFQLAGQPVDPDLIRDFFTDKGREDLVARFASVQYRIERAHLIEMLSNPVLEEEVPRIAFAPKEPQTAPEPTLFEMISPEPEPEIRADEDHSGQHTEEPVLGNTPKLYPLNSLAETVVPEKLKTRIVDLFKRAEPQTVLPVQETSEPEYAENPDETVSAEALVQETGFTFNETFEESEPSLITDDDHEQTPADQTPEEVTAEAQEETKPIFGLYYSEPETEPAPAPELPMPLLADEPDFPVAEMDGVAGDEPGASLYERFLAGQDAGQASEESESYIEDAADLTPEPPTVVPIWQRFLQDVPDDIHENTDPEPEFFPVQPEPEPEHNGTHYAARGEQSLYDENLGDLLSEYSVEYVDLLFYGDERRYRRAVRDLEGLNSWKEAQIYLKNEMLNNSDIDPYDEVFVRFVDQLQEFYS